LNYTDTYNLAPQLTGEQYGKMEQKYPEGEMPPYLNQYAITVSNGAEWH